VCNVALVRIGHTQLLESLSGSDVVSKTCAALFPFTRDQLLQARPWPFATLRRALAVLADDAADDEHRDGWDFTYALPADCIAPRYIWNGGQENPGEDQTIPYRIESSRDLKSRVLLANFDDAQLVYTAKVVEVPRWDPLFAEAVAMKMAADLALGIAKKPQLGLELMRAFQMSLTVASASAGNQQQALPRPESIFERGRL
jgi:hypothetical protein